MEITFSQNVNYSIDLSKGSLRRELADHLDITVRQMMKFVDQGELYDEHGDGLLDWLESKRKSWEVASEDEIEVDEVHA